MVGSIQSIELRYAKVLLFYISYNLVKMAISLASLMAMTSLDEAEKVAISIALIYVRGTIALRYKRLMTMAFDKATGCHHRASNPLVIQQRPPWSS